MTVGEMLERISSKEITEWQAYFLLLDEDRKFEEKKAAARRGRR
jgi:hypothetical protein